MVYIVSVTIAGSTSFWSVSIYNICKTAFFHFRNVDKCFFCVKFLKCQSFGCLTFEWRDRNLSSFIKNNLFCVLKMNEILMVLERHKRISESSFLSIP